MNKPLIRCPFCKGSELYQDYHDQEWGVPLKDDQALFELLILEGAQAGLSWLTVLKKRENYRMAFDQFNPELIAKYDHKKFHELMQNPGIIRNRLKIESAISNAQAYLKLSESIPFNEFIWQFTAGKVIHNAHQSFSEIQAKTAISDAMSKSLKKQGFKFVGSTICYAFMQAAGLVNDHLVSCYRYQTLLNSHF